MFSVLLSLHAAQRPRIAHANCHQCLHLHPNKHSSLMLASLDVQTLTMLCFTLFPTCRNELQRLNCPNWAGRPNRLMATLFCRKSQAVAIQLLQVIGTRLAKCDMVTSQLTRLFGPSIPAWSLFFLYFLFFLEKHQAEASDCWGADKLPAH